MRSCLEMIASTPPPQTHAKPWRLFRRSIALSSGPFSPEFLRGIQFQRQFFFQLLSRDEMNPVHPQKDGNVNMCFHVVDKENLLGFDRSPLDGPLEDLDGRFLKSYLIGQNPLIKDLHNREF